MAASKKTGSDKPRVALNIFLLKERTKEIGGHVATWSKDEFLAKPIGANGRARRILVDEYPLDGGGSGLLYVRKPYSKHRPEWVSFVDSGLEKSGQLDKLENASYSAILVKEVRGRQFVIAFGHGRHMLDQAVVEYRFGIQVALNSISPMKIASIDKQTFDASPRISRTQAVRASELSDYGVDAEQDMLRAIVGITEKKHKDKLGEVIAGMDSLKANVKLNLKDLASLFDYALTRSLSKDYLKASDGRESAFAWVNNLQPVSDKSFVGKLDAELWRSFKDQQFEAMWLAIPDLIDWEDWAGFAYSEKDVRSGDDHPQALDIKEFAATFRRDATLQTLKSRSIFMLSARGLPAKVYSAYKSIYAEVTLGIVTYILNAGQWHKVEKSFADRTRKFFDQIARVKFDSPFIPYEHVDEAAYNIAVAATGPSYICLDRKLIAFGGAHSKIEVCDLFSKKIGSEKAKLIHVKRGRSSASLSHLFAQGLVSSELLVGEAKFVAKVDEQMTRGGFPAFGKLLKGVDYDLVYAIIDGPQGKPLDLPFFSKVNLEHCSKRLRSYGFTVKILHIPESQAFIAGTVAKKATKAAAKNAVAKKVGATKAVAKKTAPKKTAPKKTAPKKTAPKKTAPKKTAPKKTVPKKTATKKTVGQRVSPRTPRLP